MYVVNAFLFVFLQNGATPLIIASENGHMKVVDYLLKQGAKVDQQNKVCREIICSNLGACWQKSSFILRTQSVLSVHVH